MIIEFKNIGKCITSQIRGFLFENKLSFYPNEELTIDDIRVEKNDNSKVYECYLNGILVAFIILEYFENDDESVYEISFGKFDKNVDFSIILNHFIQSYNEKLKIFAVVESQNLARKRIYNILEQAGFIYRYDICVGNERVFIPKK